MKSMYSIFSCGRRNQQITPVDKKTVTSDSQELKELKAGEETGSPNRPNCCQKLFQRSQPVSQSHVGPPKAEEEPWISVPKSGTLPQTPMRRISETEVTIIHKLTT